MSRSMASKAAFGQVFREHYPRVLRHAHSLCGNREDAEDIAQEVFIGVMKGLPGFRGEAEIETWIYRITTRVAAKCLARRSRFRKMPPPRDQPAEENGAEDKVARDELFRALDQLSLPQRTIVSLVCIEGLTHQTVADILGIPVGTVWSRLHAARRHLASAVSAQF